MTIERPWLKQYRPGVPAEVGDLPYQSVADMLLDSCKKFKDLPAYVNFGKSMTYGELDSRSRDLAAYLQAHYQTGDAIAIMMPNVLQFDPAAGD